MRYKIDFLPTLVICIIVLILGQVWTYLGDLPEAFTYGSIIYKVVATIFYVLTNLAIGTAAAIVFYFMTQLLEKKKTFDIYTDLRADACQLFYVHTMILKEIQGFEGLSVVKTQRYGDLFIAEDIPVFIESYRNIESELVFENNLKAFFLDTPKERLELISYRFKRTIQSLEINKNKRYFKGSKDLIESVTVNFEDDLSISLGWMINPKSEKEKLDNAEDTVSDYLVVLQSSIDLYEGVQEFIDCIEKKKIIKLMRMLD